MHMYEYKIKIEKNFIEIDDDAKTYYIYKNWYIMLYIYIK